MRMSSWHVYCLLLLDLVASVLDLQLVLRRGEVALVLFDADIWFSFGFIVADLVPLQLLLRSGLLSRF